MHSNKCNLTVLLHLYPISNEQKSVRNASIHIGKITDKNLLLFSSQTKFAQQKAEIIPFNAATMLLACHVVGKKVCTLAFQ